MALARPRTHRQPLSASLCLSLLQAWTSAVDPRRTIPLCSLLCGYIPCHFMSPFFFCSSSYVKVYEETRIYGVGTAESAAVCTASTDANRRYRHDHSIQCSSSSRRAQLIKIYSAACSRRDNKNHSRYLILQHTSAGGKFSRTRFTLSDNLTTTLSSC